ncbi:DUF3801 domain-containing protein [Acutalibacter muris]|uniref:DUF3801 domain-containing protein n=1 Tax=Acutalibacter muris TaxID=1796620 RepID=UPI0027297F8E|nr:DUF3801 domain-containing protein [Acutalibacter muris]
MFRVTYKGIAYVFRIIEEAAQMANRNNARLASVIAGMNQQDYSTRSAMEMERMLQQGKGFCQFDLMEKDYKTFYDAAMAAGVRFSCVSLDKIHPEGERLFTIFCSPDQADIVNRIIEINELNGVKSADYEQESAREVTPKEVEVMTEEELRQRNRSMNADFITQFIDEVQPHATQNPTTPAERGNAAPSGVWSTSTVSGRQSVKARVTAIRLGAGKEVLGLPSVAGSTPSRDDAARNFYEKNMPNLSTATREI